MNNWSKFIIFNEPRFEVEVERTRQIALRAREILAQSPKPDTFLGRKTFEPPRKAEARLTYLNASAPPRYFY
jgi:hypothetical protein